MSRAGSRAYRVEVVEADPLGRSHYTGAFGVAASADDRTAEQWARSAFEAAPPAARWFVLAGWRFVLGLRLGPRPSTGHVLGWTIVSSTPDVIGLEARSALVTAYKVVRVEDSRVVMSTFIRYERPVARAVWSAIAPVHHLLEPYLLGHAASRTRAR